MQSLTNVEQIFVVITVLYLIEMLVWARSGTYVVRSVFGKFQLQHSRAFLSNDIGRLFFCGPAPWDAAFLMRPTPVSINRDGITNVCVASPASEQRPLVDERFVSIDDVNRITIEDHRLFMDGTDFCATQDKHQAKNILAKLKHLATVPTDQRNHIIDSDLTASFDTGYVSQRIELWRRTTYRLRVFGTLMFVWLCVGVGLYFEWYARYYKDDIFVPYMFVLMLFWWNCVLRFYAAHRQLYPERRWERCLQLLVTFVSPASAMRASDHLARQLLTDSHPVPVLIALNAIDKMNFVAATCRDAIYPIPLEVEGESALEIKSVANEYHAMYVERLRRCVEECQLSFEELTLPPSDLSEEALSYCERCHNEFIEREAVCGLCSDRLAKVTSLKRHSG
jgi:hypothetical protein